MSSIPFSGKMGLLKLILFEYMKKFMVLYHTPAGATEKMSASTPKEMKEGMKSWIEWAKKCGDGLVGMGNPLGNGQKITKSGVSQSGKGVVGYSILQAKDMDGAVEMLKGHPHLEWMDACQVEVHEMMPLPGM